MIRTMKCESYNDGTLELWTVVAGENVKIANLRYENKTIGVERHYAAKKRDEQVDKLVKTPFVKASPDEFVIIGGEKYEILQVQELPDATPKSMLLSLRSFGSELSDDEANDKLVGELLAEASSNN